jgi:hypothetical protein
MGTPLTCSSGQRCSNGSCICDSTSCPSGCCSGSQCLQRITCYPDGDGDGYGDSASSGQQFCQQSCPSGSVTNKNDCYDLNPNAHPGAGYPNIQEGANRGDGSYDFDCNGIIEFETKQQFMCDANCQLTGPFLSTCTPGGGCTTCFHRILTNGCDLFDTGCQNEGRQPEFLQRCK